MTRRPPQDPIVRAHPFLAELHDGDRFLLYRGPDDPDMPPDAGEPSDELLIAPSDLTALRTVLMEVWAHPRFVEGRWDAAPGTTDPPWEVVRTAAAVVVAGPVWDATLHSSGELVAELPYGRLEGLLAALNAL